MELTRQALEQLVRDAILRELTTTLGDAIAGGLTRAINSAKGRVEDVVPADPSAAKKKKRQRAARAYAGRGY